LRLLVVEDEERIASFLHKGFTSRGYSVDCVATGSEALAHALDGSTYHLLLLDLGLPDLDGLEVLERLRARGCRVPVIVLTARSEDRDRTLALGVDDFLVKPVPFAELLALVRARTELGDDREPHL
jgi:two-component system copper resistance phosphate regulon response regulator CusR